MSTITTAQYNDDGTTARSAGEVLTVNGGTITFRTDTRTSAGVNNTIGGNSVISATLGGGIVFDGRNVRWLAITGGSGTCSVGTAITQGGVSGTFLGYWANLTSRGSTTIGATGFIKLREVTGGAFAAGALSGITATAAGADVTGWLEIAADQVANFSVPRLGNFTVRGDWFYLDNTTGSAGQIIQTPTNGGGSATEAPGIWIETGEGTGVFDFFPSLETTTEFTTTSLGTDARAKFVHNMLGGQLRIGSDGTNNIGYVPPAGCKTRIPNVIGRQTSSANRALNLAPHTTIASRPDFTTTSAGYIDIEYFYNDWYLLFAQPYYVKMQHVGTFDTVNISECATALDLSDGFTGMTLDGDINSLLLTSCFAGGTITDWGGPRGNAAGASDHDIALNYCIGQTLTRVRGGILAYARSSGYPISINQCTDITLNNCRCTNGPLSINTAFNVAVNDHDHVDRYVGATTAASGYAVQIANSCDGVLVDGITFGMQGAIANCHPYTGIVTSAASSNIKVRNIGTRSAPINAGSANQCAVAFIDGGNNVNLKFQRCYLSTTRTGIATTANSSKNVLLEHVYGDYADAWNNAYLNGTVRACAATQGVTGQASVYGTHWTDSFTSDTVGRIVALMNESTAETAAYNTLTAGAGSGFTSAGGLSLATVGDEYITGMHYSALGHLALSATAPVVTGTNVTYSSGSRWGNHDLYYQVDTGSGYGGTWLNFTNDLSQTIEAAGTKFKLRIVCAVANTTNLISFIRMNSTTSTAAMDANMYPLDTNTISFTGLPTGCDLVVLEAGTTNVLHSKDGGVIAEYIANGSFNAAVNLGADCSAYGGSFTAENGYGRFVSDGSGWPGINYSLTGLSIGQTYSVFFSARSVSAGNMFASVTNPAPVAALEFSFSNSAFQDFTGSFVASATTHEFIIIIDAGTTDSGDTFDVDNISVLSTVSESPNSYTYEGESLIDVGFIKPGYVPYYIRGLALTTTDSSIPVTLIADRNYIA